MASPADDVQPIEPTIGLGDLRLSGAVLDALRSVVSEARSRHRGRGGRAGLTVLFAGESGPAKTLAAEAVAGELGSTLYRVDLAAVMHKYIGETEKNLRRLFDTAEKDEAVLFFDEADALFGKRTANIEINDLFDRAEKAGGLSVFGVGAPVSGLDPELRLRLGVVVDFPDPSGSR